MAGRWSGRSRSTMLIYQSIAPSFLRGSGWHACGTHFDPISVGKLSSKEIRDSLRTMQSDHVGEPGDIPQLDLASLENGFPCITPAEGRRLAEAGAVCLERQGHTHACRLAVTGILSTICELKWPSVHDQMRRSFDLQEATERGACGVAILLVKQFTDYHVVERSY